MNLYNNHTQDEVAYKVLCQLYLNTRSDVIRHIAENALVQLLRKGVKPCGKNGN